LSLLRLSLVLETGFSRVSADDVPLIVPACSPVTDVPLGLRLLLVVRVSLALAAGRSLLAAPVSATAASPLLTAGCSLFGIELGLFEVGLFVTTSGGVLVAGAGFGAACGAGAGGEAVACGGFGAGAATPLVSRGRSGDTLLAPAACLSVHVPVDPAVRSTGFSEPATRGCGEGCCWGCAGGAAFFVGVVAVFFVGAVAVFSPRSGELAFSVCAEEAVTLSLLT